MEYIECCEEQSWPPFPDACMPYGNAAQASETQQARSVGAIDPGLAQENRMWFTQVIYFLEQMTFRDPFQPQPSCDLNIFKYRQKSEVCL